MTIVQVSLLNRVGSAYKFALCFSNKDGKNKTKQTLMVRKWVVNKGFNNQSPSVSYFQDVVGKLSADSSAKEIGENN